MSATDLVPKEGHENAHGRKTKSRKSSRSRRSARRESEKDPFGDRFVWTSAFTDEGGPDPWEPFEDLVRVDSGNEEEPGAFSDFEPFSLDRDTDAVADHDLLL